MVKHDDWRSAAPFFEVVAAKLQGPSPGPETLAWPPNYHYGGSPFRARCPLPGTKLLGRGPARRAPLTYLLSASFFSRPPPCIYPPVPSPPSWPVDRPTKYLLLPLCSPSSLRFGWRLSIFSCAPRHENDRVRGIIKSFDETRTRYSRLTSRSSRSSVELRSRDRYVRPLVGVKQIVPSRCDRVTADRLECVLRVLSKKKTSRHFLHAYRETHTL